MNNRLMRPRARRPDAPRILTANQTSGLTWSRPASNGARIIEYRVYENGAFLDVLDGSTTTFPQLPLPGSVFQVSAVNSIGEGAKSRSVVAV